MKSIPPPVLAAVVAVLVVIALVVGWRTLNPSTEASNVGTDGKKIEAPSSPTTGVTPEPGKAATGPQMAPANN